MLFRLEEVQPGKTVTREIALEEASIEMLSGKAVFTNIQGEFKCQCDPMGYVIHYRATAHVTTPCIRCGETLEKDIVASDWVSLRTSQPEDSHIVLGDAEMNVRFIPNQTLDMNAFALEVVELELADYPRHEEGDPACKAIAPEVVEEKSSPFNVLSKFLD